MQPFLVADDPPLSSMSRETAVDMEEVRLKVEIHDTAVCSKGYTCTYNYVHVSMVYMLVIKFSDHLTCHLY